MLLPVAAFAQPPTTEDPRFGLGAGGWDAEEAIFGLQREGFFDKRDGTFINPASLGSISFANSDLAMQGNYVYMGNFNGFQVFDISSGEPVLKTEVLCPGGQGDPSVYGNLLFMSVEETRGRIDCGTGGADAETRFRGVRIFDISNPLAPVQVAGVQTCRGSHTHTVVSDPNDPANVYVYVSGTAGTRSAAELEECNGGGATTPQPSRWRIEVIKVPLANPAAASIVNYSYLFTNEAGAVNGLNSATDACHDITAYPEIGLAAGACEGNGLLIDISNPADPKRIDFVADTVNFAYWHSATFNNDGTKVVFTDELGGGTSARCRTQDALVRGANGIYDIVETADGLKMEFRSYYKMPVQQTNQENCVAHNGSLLPVPGRDILIQAWYQGGISISDFTDSSNPVEIAYFDRGPFSASSLVLSGFWSAYWYNGRIYGSEIGRGMDVFSLAETDLLSEAEIAAAAEITTNQVNVQLQQSYSWGPSANVVGAFRDQAIRADAIGDAEVLRINAFLTRASLANSDITRKLAAEAGYAVAERLDGEAHADLIDAIELLADDLNPRDN